MSAATVTANVLDISTCERALSGCRIVGGGNRIAASGGRGSFNGSQFTRDTLVIMGDLMQTHPNLVRSQFSLLPEAQGIDDDPLTDQQDGRLPHQVAKNVWGGIRLPDSVIEQRRFWAKLWGVPFDEHEGFTVYNQTDGIRYVCELWRFVDLYGPDVMSDQFIHRPTGEVRTVRQATLSMMDWLVRSIDGSDDGLFAVREMNPRQTSWSGVMRDGRDSYWHSDGSPVNARGPIAYGENQGLAVQACRGAIRLFDGCDDPKIEKRKQRWSEIVSELPGRAFEAFRWDDMNTLVPAIDRDAQNAPRQVRMVGSATAEMLATPELFDGIPEGLRKDVVRGIVLSNIFSEEIMTEAGPRMVSTRSEGDVPRYRYQGSRTVWPNVSSMIARGLDEMGLHELAEEIRGLRMLGDISRSGAFEELRYAQPDGAVVNLNGSDPSVVIPAEEEPSNTQTWVISAARHAIELSMKGYPPAYQQWATSLTREALAAVKDIPPVQGRSRQATGRVDTVLGKQLARGESSDPKGPVLLAS